MSERFNYVKRGYDPAEVDKYIETLESVITSYKEKDAAIKNALINAQIAADNIVKNAELEVVNSKARAVAQLDKIAYSIQKQKTLVDNMRRDYSKIVDEYLKEIDERDFKPIYDQIAQLELYIESLKAAPEQNAAAQGTPSFASAPAYTPVAPSAPSFAATAPQYTPEPQAAPSFTASMLAETEPSLTTTPPSSPASPPLFTPTFQTGQLSS